MILKTLKYLSYLVLIFGFFYMTWHWGVMKGKEQERLHGENVVLMSDCFESDLFIKCTHTYINSEIIKNLYEEVRDELRKSQALGGAGNNNVLDISSNPPPRLRVRK